MRNFKSAKPAKPLPRGGKSLAVIDLCGRGSFTREQLAAALNKVGGTPAGMSKGEPNPVDNWATQSFLAPFGIGLTFEPIRGGKSWRATATAYKARSRPTTPTTPAAE